MCGVLRLENQAGFIKGILPDNMHVVLKDKPCRGTLTEKPVFWDGHAREESINEWLGTWRRAEIHADSYWEGKPGKLYHLQPNHVVKAIALDRDEQVVVRILTREARGMEKLVHNRFPVTAKQNLDYDEPDFEIPF